MQRFCLLLGFILSLLITMPVTAQDDAVVCPSPFPVDSDPAQVVMTIGEAQIPAGLFANRVRFEHAYNAIKLEIRVTQLTDAAAESNITDAAAVIAADPQVQQINAENDDLTRLGNRVLSELASDVVVRDYAADNDISITQSDFDTTVDNFFAFNDTTTEETRQTTLDDFSRRILASGTAPQEITTFFCRQTLYNAVQQQVITPQDSVLYVNAAHILVSSQAVAQDIINLLDSGESFETLVQQLSLDTPTLDSGGVIGFQPAIFFPPTFADAVTEAELDTVLSPVQTQFGWHVIRVLAREERPINEDERSQIENTQFSRWRGEQINASDIAINPDWQSAIPQL